MDDPVLYSLAEELGQFLLKRHWLITTAESCTGGYMAQTITSVPDSSKWFERSFVTYSNQAKIDMLNVSKITLQDQGAVSEAVVSEMALGALKHSKADLCIAVSGVAGPGGGTVDKPVGMVCFGFGIRNQTPKTLTEYFTGDRAEIRRKAVIFALSKVLEM